MTTIPGRMPVANFTRITLPDSARIQLDPDKFAEMKRLGEEMRRERSPEETAQQIAKQRAVKVHTVYRVDGEVIGAHKRNDWTTFASNTVGDVRGNSEQIGLSRGLSGDALQDFVADHITEQLTKKYGDRLTVETYEDAALAPTSGEVNDVMFGRRASYSTPSPSSARVSFDADTFALLSRFRQA